MNFVGKKILIAGAAGFLGTNLALALAKTGAHLRLAVHKKPLKVSVPGAEIVSVDLRLPDDCARAADGMDYVFLCAAQTSGAAVIRATPLVHITPNVLINTLMLEAAYQAKVAKFCFLSSGAVYPPTGDRPVTETEMFDGNPHAVYFAAGWMKRYAEILCQTYAEKIARPMATLVVRPSNVYGPHDKYDFAVSHVTAALIRRVVERHAPLEVWGTGLDIRDLIYVDDFVEGVLAAFASDRTYLAVNICGGQGYSIRQVLQKILEAEEWRDADVRYDPSRPSTVPILLMDNSLARREFGFEARTSLDDGLRRTIQWYRKNATAV